MRWRGRFQAAGRARYTAVILAPLLVLGALSLGPRIGPFGLLAPLPATEPLDYASRPGSAFAPLSERFVASVLGPGADEKGPGDPAIALGSPGGLVPQTGVTAERLTDVHPLTNDDVADARFVPSVPFTAKTDTRKATRETSEPDDCAAVGASTVWYRYTAERDIGLIANTFGSSYATALGVFRGKPGSLARVGCDTDARANSIVAFPAKKATTYYFQIVGPAGGGDLVFNLDPQGVTRIASLGSDGQRLSEAAYTTISGDGRFVAFAAAGGLYVRDLERSTTTLVSVDSSGRPANGRSTWPYISHDGRHAAFSSAATNLVKGDTNDAFDVFVHDLASRTTERISLTSSGGQLVDRPAAGGARKPTISADGRAVTFTTLAAMVPEDHNEDWDVYVRDRVTRTTERVSVSSTGAERGGENCTAGYAEGTPACGSGPQTGGMTDVDGDVLAATISPNGRFVRFNTGASNIVPNDTNAAFDTFVHDRVTHRTERVSFTLSGKQRSSYSGTNNEFSPRQGFSYDGRFVVYVGEESDATFSNYERDVYVFDRQTKRTSIASLSSTGKRKQGNTDARGASISADGRYVAFHSEASNLAPGDTNEVADVFVRDLHTGTTTRVSVTTAGEPTDGSAAQANLSGDGGRVAYASLVAQQSPGPTAVIPGESATIFVLDRAGSGR